MSLQNRIMRGSVGENGGASERNWIVLPLIVSILFVVYTIVAIPTKVTLPAKTMVFADKWLSRPVGVTITANEYTMVGGSFYAYQMQDANGKVVGWVSRIGFSDNTFLAFAPVISWLLFSLALFSWSVRISAPRQYGPASAQATCSDNLNAAIQDLVFNYSTRVNLDHRFILDAGRAIGRHLIGWRPAQLLMEFKNFISTSLAPKYTVEQFVVGIGVWRDDFNRALGLYNSGELLSVDESREVLNLDASFPVEEENRREATARFISKALPPMILAKIKKLYLVVESISFTAQQSPDSVAKIEEQRRERARLEELKIQHAPPEVDIVEWGRKTKHWLEDRNPTPEEIERLSIQFARQQGALAIPRKASAEEAQAQADNTKADAASRTTRTLSELMERLTIGDTSLFGAIGSWLMRRGGS